jgi:Leucine-rich repeat (LRR) protein
LKLSNCTGIRNLSPLARLIRLEDLDFSGCFGITDLSPLRGLVRLNTLKLSNCIGIRNLSPLARLTMLEDLDLSGCSGITNVSSLEGLIGLIELDISGCSGITDFSALSGLENLCYLNLSKCTGLKTMPSLALLINLESLSCEQCTGLIDLSGLSGFESIHILNFSGCISLKNLSGLSALRVVHFLKLSGCTSLENLLGLSGLIEVNDLNLSGCTSLMDLSGVSRLVRVLNLNLSGCTKLRSISFSNFKIQTLIMDGCQGFVREWGAYGFIKLLSLRNCCLAPNLSRYIGSRDCGGIRHFNYLSFETLPKGLTFLNMSGARGFKRFPLVSEMETLEGVRFEGCKDLEVLPDLSECKSLKFLDLQETRFVEGIDKDLVNRAADSMNSVNIAANGENSGIVTVKSLIDAIRKKEEDVFCKKRNRDNDGSDEFNDGKPVCKLQRRE